MPIEHTINHRHRVIVSAHIGLVEDEEFLQSYRCLYEDEAFDASYGHLVDLRSTQSKARSVEALRAVLHLVVNTYRQAGRSPRIAVVAPKDLSFGLSRMHQALTATAAFGPDTFMVFRTVDPALAWLQVPPDALPDAPEPS